MTRAEDARNAIGPAALAVAGMAIVAGGTALVVPRADLVVLGGALALMLSRSHLVESWRGRVEAFVALPVVALAVTGVGLAFRLDAWLGAALFTVAMVASVWLRRFGTVGRRVGALLALPFLTLLITPVAAAPVHGAPTGVVVPVIAIGALIVVVGLRMLAERVGILPRSLPAAASDDAPDPPSRLRPIPSTRMAAQLAVALAAGWTLGLLLVPEHAGWIVLSAYLVLARARGRADVLLTGGLRLGGAVAGSLAAVPLLAVPAIDGVVLGGIVILLLGVGTVLRAMSYAWWALVMTLVMTLLQHETTGIPTDLGLRVMAILAGCVLGALAAWFVLPIRSEAVLRLRLAAALAALDEYWATASGDRAALDGALARVDEVAAPWRAIAWIPLARARRNARWIALTHDVADREAPSSPPRRELGEARRAIREPARLLEALEALRATFG